MSPGTVAYSRASLEETTPSAGLALVAISLLWGATPLAIKVSLRDFPPLEIAAWRFGLGALVLYSWALVTKISLDVPLRDWIAILPMASIFAVQIALLNVGVKYTYASRASILVQLHPFWVLLLAHFFIPGDRLRLRKAVGLLCAFAGIVTIFQGRGAGLAARPLGDVLIVTSSAALGVRTVWAARLVQRIPPVPLVFWQFVLSSAMFLTASLALEDGNWWLLGGSPPAVGAILYQGIGVAGICFAATTAMLKKYKPSSVTSFFFIIPAAGVVYAVLLLKDPLPWNVVLGGGLVGVGILIVNWRVHKR